VGREEIPVPAPHAAGWSASYAALAGKAFGFCGFTGRLIWREGSETTPGEFGARTSELYQMLRKGHNEVKLTAQELHRITLWLDCNSVFYGSYRYTGRQIRGDIVMPGIE
jgi:hypothetical protein